MDFLRPLLAKIELICQQPAMPQLSEVQGVASQPWGARYDGWGSWGGLTMLGKQFRWDFYHRVYSMKYAHSLWFVVFYHSYVITCFRPIFQVYITTVGAIVYWGMTRLSHRQWRNVKWYVYIHVVYSPKNVNRDFDCTFSLHSHMPLIILRSIVINYTEWI